MNRSKMQPPSLKDLQRVKITLTQSVLKLLSHSLSFNAPFEAFAENKDFLFHILGPI